MHYEFMLIARRIGADRFKRKQRVLRLVLGVDELRDAVHRPQLGLLYLAGGIARDGGENYPVRALVAREAQAVFVYLLLGAALPLLHLDDGGGNFAEAGVRQADNGNVLYLLVGGEEILYLDGVNVLAAGNNNVLLAVNEPDEAIRVLLRHVSGEKPAVPENGGGGLRVFIIAAHYAGALDAKLADLALLDGRAAASGRKPRFRARLGAACRAVFR